jgi:hypothetical protein
MNQSKVNVVISSSNDNDEARNDRSTSVGVERPLRLFVKMILITNRMVNKTNKMNVETKSRFDKCCRHKRIEKLIKDKIRMNILKIIPMDIGYHKDADENDESISIDTGTRSTREICT